MLVELYVHLQGRIQDFKLVGGGGAHFKKLRRSEGCTNIFGVFRVKNHDFMPKNHIFSNFRGVPPTSWICPWLGLYIFPLYTDFSIVFWTYSGILYFLFYYFMPTKCLQSYDSMGVLMCSFCRHKY